MFVSGFQRRKFLRNKARLYLILFQRMSSAVQSRLEKRFKTTSVYKRSKPYFDISRLNKLEQKEELSRRKPEEKRNEGINTKFSESFYSADLKNQERVQTELTKFHTRGWKEDLDETDTDYTFSTKKGKSLDMNKMLPRTYYNKNTSFSQNENNFCNFRPYILPNNHCVYFEKCLSPAEHQINDSPKLKTQACQRCKSKLGQPFDSIPSITEPEVGQVRQKMIFDQSLYRTLVDYKKNSKEKSERRQQCIEPEVHLERIRLGEELTKKMANLGLVQFYHGETKWRGPQMDNRLLKHNEYWLRLYNKDEIRKIEWTMQKKKADLIQSRKAKILCRKHIKDVKGETCDQKFFRRNHY